MVCMWEKQDSGRRRDVVRQHFMRRVWASEGVAHEKFRAGWPHALTEPFDVSVIEWCSFPLLSPLNCEWQTTCTIIIRSVSTSGNHGALSSTFGLAMKQNNEWDWEFLDDHENVYPQEIVEFLRRALDFPKMWDRGVCKFNLNLKYRWLTLKFYIVRESETQKGEGTHSRSYSKVETWPKCPDFWLKHSPSGQGTMQMGADKVVPVCVLDSSKIELGLVVREGSKIGPVKNL